MAADYHYISTWQLQAPIERVWAAISDLAQLPAWYPAVQEVQTLTAGPPGGATGRRWVRGPGMAERPAAGVGGPGRVGRMVADPQGSSASTARVMCNPCQPTAPALLESSPCQQLRSFWRLHP